MKTILFLLVLLIVISGCSSRKAPDVYAEGLAAETGGDPKLALELYEEVVRDFSAEAVAETAMYKIVMMRGNNPAEKQVAVDAQRRYLDLFPGSTRTPTVMFMMAFLYNNEMDQTDSARKYYDMFLSKYPDHELVPSARFELETLGKAPGDILLGGEEAGGAGTPSAKNGEARP